MKQTWQVLKEARLEQRRLDEQRERRLREDRELGWVKCPNHPDRPAASPSSNLCGPCLMGRAS